MAAPTVSVITPTTANPARMGWLLAAHTSLHVSRTGFEHLIVVDGGNPDRIPTAVSNCPDARVVTLPVQVGAAAARNLGLHAATGRYVTTLDDDDMLTAHSLDVRAHVLDGDVAWVGGQLAHLHPDGSDTPWAAPAGSGWMSAGAVMASWPDPAGTVPLGPTTLMTTVTLMRAIGGWAGLPTGEDLAMLAALTGVADGQLLDDIVYLYRSHPDQSLKTSPFTGLEAAARDIAHQRAAALRHVR